MFGEKYNQILKQFLGDLSEDFTDIDNLFSDCESLNTSYEITDNDINKTNTKCIDLERQGATFNATLCKMHLKQQRVKLFVLYFYFYFCTIFCLN